MSRPTYEELTSDIEKLNVKIQEAQINNENTDDLELSLLLVEEILADTIAKGTP